MTLSCKCDWDYDYDPGDWCYDLNRPNEYDFEPLQTRRRVRCCSCKELIDIGALCIRHRRHRYPYDDIEAQIKRGCDLETAMNGEPTIRISDHFQCERCGEIWLNLQALGYECLSPNEDMEESLAEYHEMTGFKKEPKRFLRKPLVPCWDTRPCKPLKYTSTASSQQSGSSGEIDQNIL